MKQFGPAKTHQRNVRLWAFQGPCFEDQRFNYGEGEGEARDAAGGTGVGRAIPDGNHGDNLREVQQ